MSDRHRTISLRLDNVEAPRLERLTRHTALSLSEAIRVLIRNTPPMELERLLHQEQGYSLN